MKKSSVIILASIIVFLIPEVIFLSKKPMLRVDHYISNYEVEEISVTPCHITNCGGPVDDTLNEDGITELTIGELSEEDIIRLEKIAKELESESLDVLEE